MYHKIRKEDIFLSIGLPKSSFGFFHICYRKTQTNVLANPVFQMVLITKEVKSLTVSIVSSCICHEMMGLDAMILDF